MSSKKNNRYKVTHLPSISVQVKHMALKVQNELADLERDDGVHKLQLCFVHPEVKRISQESFVKILLYKFTRMWNI